VLKREARDLTAAELGERAGLGVDLIERIEGGEHDPYLTELVALANALDLTPADLVTKGTRSMRDESIGAPSRRTGSRLGS
jgi:transcriptional regulator with XRE-family HTH domain